MHRRRAFRVLLPVTLLLLLSGRAVVLTQGSGQASGQVKTSVSFRALEMMVGTEDDYTRWDESLAVGTYSQSFGSQTATGSVLDMGALQLPDGTTYPVLLVEGPVLFARTAAAPQPIAKVTNSHMLALAPKETLWTSADGKSMVVRARGIFFLVLDSKGFPQTMTVIGVADSKVFYRSPKA